MPMPETILKSSLRTDLFVRVNRLLVGRSASAQCIPEDSGGCPVAFGQGVGVTVECHRRLGVPMTFSDGADIHPGG
jgi:hypothetical protein